MLVQRFDGSGEYQMTATLFGTTTGAMVVPALRGFGLASLATLIGVALWAVFSGSQRNYDGGAPPAPDAPGRGGL